MFHMKRLGWSPLRVLLDLETLLQLTAGRVDIVAAGITDRGLDASRLKTALKIFNLMDRRWLERATLDIVKLNQVDVAQRALAEVAERLHLGVGVVDTLNHGVLIGWTAAGLFSVELKGLVEAQERVLLNARHELVARRLDSGVQRDGERELLGNICKLANSRDNAAGGNGKVTCSNADAIGVVEDAQRLEDLVVVGKRLALTHKNDTRCTLAKVVGDVEHLVNDLLCGQ